MPHSLSKVYLHNVFSTKYRKPLVTSELREPLHGYMVGTLSDLGSYVEAIYMNPDHLHVLCTLPRTLTIASLIGKLKTSSTKWMKNHGVRGYAWQGGYGSFSVSPYNLSVVRNYILNQEAHHRKQGFKDEYRAFLKEYQVEYNEDYVWD